MTTFVTIVAAIPNDILFSFFGDESDLSLEEVALKERLDYTPSAKD
jgi:hypothetical protein